MNRADIKAKGKANTIALALLAFVAMYAYLIYAAWELIKGDL